MSSDIASGASRVDFGARQVQWRRHGVSVRFPLRALLVCAALAVLLGVGAVVGLTVGSYAVDLGRLVDVLTGTDGTFARTVVLEWRAPRVLAAVVFGAALGASGAVFQSVTRNPLASPDVIGFATGSYTGAIVVLIVLGGGYTQVASGALVGGVATAAVVYLLAYRGGITGFRFIIVGIGVSAMLTAFNSWLLLRAQLEVAMSAAVWGAGSLNGITWEQTGVATAVVMVLILALGLLARPMQQMQLGDDAARAIGIRVEPSRLGLIIVGVALTAAVTAAAGPISFIALAAPQVARRLARTPGITLWPSAVVGAVLLLASDLVAQHALPQTLPVGVVTFVIGGTYLTWLLIHEIRKLP
ncbi:MULTISPECIES: iron chelate uptake ABC transporter family permease subunit [unclassified Dietzia]|uniref:FecCD family ABC transporter permease n=1 Tax=unclassified Dietzia TaxID=2617939 RepID=UPI000D22A089|nr:MULTISPECIES: iron chelate uptake ABC transporter family permease subunit [unclassified Dietzia]AVZ40017.1 iron ABC transporter permease [Dietzia sp. JS16-p6b]MBB1023083.1 iron chelate uptake ABC transporter family permease subunit [Dietzia sp. DQ12-76]MBB1026731.1 iron chelate uptake ABC transporter family permease subunit [Dietzia sp. DQ11-38-2]